MKKVIPRVALLLLISVFSGCANLFGEPPSDNALLATTVLTDSQSVVYPLSQDAAATAYVYRIVLSVIDSYFLRIVPGNSNAEILSVTENGTALSASGGRYSLLLPEYVNTVIVVIEAEDGTRATYTVYIQASWNG